MRKKLIAMIYFLIALSFITFGILYSQILLIDPMLAQMISIP